MKTSSRKLIVKLVPALSFILAPAVHSATLSLKVGTVESSGQSIELPLSAVRCDGLGALQFSLGYDAELIEPTSVDAGGDLTGGLVAFDIKSPGTLRVAMISSKPVNGPGELLKITFRRINPEGSTSDLTVTEATAWDHQTNTEMLVTHEAGMLTLTRKSGLIPDNLVPDSLIPDYLKMPILIGWGVVALLIPLTLVRNHAKRRKNSTPALCAFCSNCGSAHSHDAQFCAKCGREIP